MNNKNLFWIPRILAIIYILFISLFTLDLEFGIGFLINLIPSLIFIVCLIVAWIKPKIGGILFVIAGIGTIIFYNTYKEWLSFLMISLPPILAGSLFIFLKRKK